MNQHYDLLFMIADLTIRHLTTTGVLTPSNSKAEEFIATLILTIGIKEIGKNTDKPDKHNQHPKSHTTRIRIQKWGKVQIPSE